jgi:Na+/melibiose symporter-like transporter
VSRLSRGALLAYGLFGLPLAMLALPVYVLVPQLYANRFGLSLSVIGSMLLVARVLDACIDPALGLWIDRAKSARGYAGFVLLSLPLLIAGYLALFHPPPMAAALLLWWFGGSLMLVYGGFSLATIAHNSWGASLTQERGERARLTAMREGWALVGVILAAAVPFVAGLGALSVLFVCAVTLAAWVLLRMAPRPEPVPVVHLDWRALLVPFRNRAFRWLLAVFAANGIAAAIPATLFLFFATDRLQLGQFSGLFLVLYFVAAACALPLWVALAARIGEASAWRASMLLAVAAFVWVVQLDAGAMAAFAAICIISGAALGADLALPPALLAGVIGAAGHSGQREGAYFGAWSWMTKMNLALAAGIALPLLELLGYTPGSTNTTGTQALGIAYAWVPCGLKCLAALLLWRAPLKHL